MFSNLEWVAACNRKSFSHKQAQLSEVLKKALTSRRSMERPPDEALCLVPSLEQTAYVLHDHCLAMFLPEV